jgi:hypothetical protein
MAASDIRAGRAFVELVAKDNLGAGLGRALAKLKAFGAAVSRIGDGIRAAGRQITALGDAVVGWGKRVAGAGLAVVAGLGAATKAFADMGSQLYEASIRTGVAVETLSALKFAAEQSGVEFDALELSIRKMQKTVADAAGGSGQAVTALARLGLTVKDLDGLAPDEMLNKIADGMANVQDPTARAAIALEIFGKAGTRMLPMIDQGSAAIAAFTREAAELGIVMSTQDATAAKDLERTLGALWAVTKVGVFQIGAALAPAVKALALQIIAATRAATDWIRSHREAIISVGLIAAGAAAAGTAVVSLGVALKVVGTVVSGIGSAISFAGKTVAVLAPLLGALLNPIALLTLALVGIAGYFVYTANTGGDAMKFLSGAFFSLRDDAQKAFGGIADALKAGDIALAAQILWATLKLEWNRGAAAIDRVWVNVKRSAFETWETIQAKFASGWINLIAELTQAWTSFSAIVKSVWEGTQNYLAKKWIDLMGMFDKTLDTNAAKAMLDKGSGQAQNQIAAELGQKTRGIEQNRQAQQEQNRRDYASNLSGIDSNAAAQLARDQAEIARLVAELAGLRGKAAAAGGGPSFGAFDFHARQQDVDLGLGTSSNAPAGPAAPSTPLPSRASRARR